MGNYHGSEWSPSDWYEYKATPTQKRLIKRHIEGKHTEHCILYDSNHYGTYCKWLTNVFWPIVYLTQDIDLAAGEPK